MADDFFPGASTGNPAGFISGAIDDGIGSTAALRAYREAGGSIRNETWFRLYGEVSDALARSPEAAALDPFSIPDASDYSTWTVGKGGEYMTQVKVFFRDVDTGIVGSNEYTYKTSEPHTPAEAEAAAYDEYADADNASDYGQAILGTATTNVFRTVAL